MREHLTKALEAADRDWRNNVGEHDHASLDRMFRTSGFARQAPRPDDAKVPDWCGMAVGTWLVDGGMNPAYARSFLHCLNVEAFFTYGRQRNVNPKRLDTQIQLEGKWQSIAAFHGGPSSSTLRSWADRGTVAEQVLASELRGRQDPSDALSMMVSSMVHMVQAGKTQSATSRWSA